jgi:inosine-uridine nucleoside N-ribohydrolase
MEHLKQTLKMGPKRIILDTDPAIGVRFKDLDDGLAILLLLASPETELEGITINFGNIDATRGFQIAHEVLQVAEASIPVFKGASSRDELGKSNPAVEYLIDTVKSNPGELTLLAIAPLTNVASAMMLDPEFAGSLKELVIMGGTFSFPFFSFFGEFNLHCDGKAAKRVIDTPIPKTLITMDVCSQAVFQYQHLRKIQEGTTAVARYLAENIPMWLDLNRKVFFRKKGFFPWDPVAVAYLLDPALFDKNPYTFTVADTGIRRGRLLNIQKHNSFDQQEKRVPINVPLQLDGVRFMELLLSRLLSL